jgi:hypothetical protein
MYISDQPFLRRGKVPHIVNPLFTICGYLYILSWSLKHITYSHHKIRWQVKLLKNAIHTKMETCPSGQDTIYPSMIKFVTKWPTLKLEGQ